MANGLLARIRSVFDGDPGIKLVAEDPVLSAELLLLFRMILADGVVKEEEMEAFRRICVNAFGIPDESVGNVIEYLNEVGYETNGGQAIAMFSGMDTERRKELARHMAEIARADADLAPNEVKLLRRTLELLGISPIEQVKLADRPV